MLKGPPLTAKLHDIILSFWEGKYVVTADISEVFHCEQIDEQYRDYLRFLWMNRDQSQLCTF